jgi:hypothetical protein
MPTKTPDLTAAQAYAWIAWAVSQLVAWHWIDHEPSRLALSAGASLLAVAWQLADAHIRGRRASVAAAALYTRIPLTTIPAAPAVANPAPSPPSPPTPTVPPTAPQS